MSAFAGFVQGVFQGMDWREARDDRKMRREWEKEDREWTRTTRGRQGTVWGQQDEDRQREIDEKEAARLREEEFARQESDLLGRIGQPNSGPGISIMDAVPADEGSERGEGRVEAPAPASISMVDLGASQSPDQAAASSMMQDRLMRNIEAARAGQEQAAAPTERQTRTAAAEPDPEMVAEGGRIAGIEPYVAGQPRAPRDQAPQEPQPSRGISLFASPAYASTMPEDGPQAPRAEPGQATIDAVQGRGQGYSDYQEATRGIRSDAPRRGTMDDMVAQERAANAPRPEQPDASPEAQARAAQAREKALSILPAGDPVTAVMDRLNRSGMGIASGAANIAGGAISSVGATDAGARMYDRGSSMKDAQRRLEAQDQATTMPAGQAAPAPRQPTGQPTPRAAQSIPGNQGPTRAAAAQLQIGGARDVPETPSIRSAGGETIQNAIAEATRSEGVSIAEAARGETTPAENRRIAEQAGRGIAQGLNMEAIGQLEQLYVQRGDFQKAEALRSWADERQTQAAFAKWGEAMTYYQLGDDEGWLNAIEDLYNMKGYYDDGLTVDKRATEFMRNDAGEIVGANIVFRDNATGRRFSQRVDGPRDMIGMAVIGAMAPDAVFERMMSEVEGMREAEAKRQPERVSATDRADAIASLAKEMAGVEGVTPEILRAAEAEYDRLIGAQRGADVPVYAD